MSGYSAPGPLISPMSDFGGGKADCLVLALRLRLSALSRRAFEGGKVRWQRKTGPHEMSDRTAACDPGCVKTPCCCYDSLVILREESMRRFVEEADRGQSTLLPECLDDFIDESNPVRVIDVFVDALDLSQMSFEGVEPAATGRPSYHPSVLLKLYIYGYLNRVQSSRRLEREAGRNVEV